MQFMTDNSREIFQGRIIRLTLDQVTLPNGRQFEMEIVHHPGGVGVLALDKLQRLCLVRQYRYLTGGWLWEIPAGKIDHQEPTAQTAQRELHEEAGLLADEFMYLGRSITSPGIFTEVVHLYLAQGLQQVDVAHEPEELIDVHWIALDSVRDWIANGTIYDAKTIVGVMLLDLYRDKK
jgi:ADP-ribose pyrophosphatase